MNIFDSPTLQNKVLSIKPRPVHAYSHWKGDHQSIETDLLKKKGVRWCTKYEKRGAHILDLQII